MPEKTGSNINIKKIKGNVVISDNQSGGITAHEQNVNSSLPKKKAFYKNIIYWICAFSAILGILAYFGFQPKLKETKKPTPKINSPILNSVIVNHSAKSLILQDTTKHKKPHVRKKHMENSSTGKPISVGTVKGNVVISQGQTGGITANTVNITSEKFQELTLDNKSAILNKLDEFFRHYPTHPRIMIQVESGDNMRNRVAIEFEDILSKYDAGIYPRGNTFMGVFPDYPVTIILNPSNKNYMDDFLKSVRSFITCDNFQFLPNERFPNDVVKFYINGKPTFDQNGSVTIN